MLSLAHGFALSDRPGIALQDGDRERPLPTTIEDPVGQTEARELTLLVDGAPARVLVPRDSFDFSSCALRAIEVEGISAAAGAGAGLLGGVVAGYFAWGPGLAGSDTYHPSEAALFAVIGAPIGAVAAGLFVGPIAGVIAGVVSSSAKNEKLEVRGSDLVAGRSVIPLVVEAAPPTSARSEATSVE